MPEQTNDAKTQAEVVAEPKPKRIYPKRNRKDYMQQYYLKHKMPSTCSGCNKEFACPRTLRYHEENNKTCMIRRLDVLFGAMQRGSTPEEGNEIASLPVMQEEMRRMKKLIGRDTASPKNTGETA